MRFNCEFARRDTGEIKTVYVALSPEEVRSVKARSDDPELFAHALAMRRACSELPDGWHHTKPPVAVLLS